VVKGCGSRVAGCGCGCGMDWFGGHFNANDLPEQWNASTCGINRGSINQATLIASGLVPRSSFPVHRSPLPHTYSTYQRCLFALHFRFRLKSNARARKLRRRRMSSGNGHSIDSDSKDESVDVSVFHPSQLIVQNTILVCRPFVSPSEILLKA